MNNSNNQMPIDVTQVKKLDVSNEPKNKKLIKILILILIIILLVFASVYSYKYFNNYVIESNKKVTYKVNYKNFTFNLLEKYEYNYNENEDYIIITDDTNDWIGKFSIIDGSYDNLLDEYLKLKPLFESKGIIVKNLNKKKLYNRDYIAMELVVDGEAQILLYSKYDNNHIITILLVNKTYTYDYVYVENIEPIISKIEVNDKNMITSKGLVLPNINDL